ncbi:MAG: twin-arginine translocation signal domain-containing protein, partial [Eudoraea sp.]|uniref:twin-arginine translocation signal domain-containing protein n=1 Tax=Eudoraea sp. TaxID=1979955 RepID=UPI003C77AB6B
MKNINRRNFIKKTSLSAACLAAATTLPFTGHGQDYREISAMYMGGFAAQKLETVRIAVIGVGARGPAHLQFAA